MARIAIPFTGITSHSNHSDGECRALVNLRPRNGYQKPVPPRKTMREIENLYDIIFTHKGASYEKWIGVKGNMVYDIENEKIPLFQIPDLYRHDGVPYVSQTVSSVQQIGNTLSFITGYNIYYAYFKEGSYTFLGELPALPSVQFSTSEMTTVSRTYHTYYPGGVTSGILTDATRSMVNILIDANREKFHDGFLIRYAFRLYDGSLIKHSPPILVMPRDHYNELGIAKLPDSIPAASDKIATDDSSEVTIKMFVLQLAYDFTSLEKWKDIIRSVDFFVSQYVGLAGAENVVDGFWHRKNNSGESNLYMGFRRSDGYYVSPSGSAGTSNTTGLNRNGRRSNAASRNGRSGSSGNTNSSIEKEIEYVTPPTIAEENDRVIGISSLYYFYYSIEEFDAKNIILPNGQVNSDMKNIIYQELMPIDDFSHHSYGAYNSSIYNNRLRLSSIRTTLFDGFSLPFFEWGSDYNGESSEEFETGPFYIHVKINSPEGVKTVQKTVYSGKLFLSSLISYPDTRAFRMEVYQFKTKISNSSSYIYDKILSIDLKPHPFLNIAYWLNDKLKPIIGVSISTSERSPLIYAKNSWQEGNKIKISEVNNPFVFPLENSYHVGSGNVLAESSIQMNVSDRNYGLYPVFVFTENGIFTLSGQTSDTVHQDIQAPTYLEPPISNVICSTPYGVAFFTKRGLMMINQYKIEFLSPQLREPDKTLHIKDNIEEVVSALKFSVNSFTDFIKGVDNMIYNPYYDELILANKETPYNYVYDFTSKTFYLSTERIDLVVQNAYPNLFFVSGNKIKDYSSKGDNHADVAIVTRPFFFKTPDIKKLERVMLRGELYNLDGESDNNKAVIITYHSDDGVNFEATRGMRISKNGSYKDFDMGLFARIKRRAYLFLFAGTVDEESEIQFLEIETDKEYTNEKMR